MINSCQKRLHWTESNVIIEELWSAASSGPGGSLGLVGNPTPTPAKSHHPAPSLNGLNGDTDDSFGGNTTGTGCKIVPISQGRTGTGTKPKVEVSQEDENLYVSTWEELYEKLGNIPSIRAVHEALNWTYYKGRGVYNVVSAKGLLVLPTTTEFAE